MAIQTKPLPWIDGYAGQTCQELVALRGKFATGGILFAIEQGLYRKDDLVGSVLTPAEELVLAVEALEREVNNGGYSQFFLNSSVRFAPIIVESLHRIGCPKTAEMAREAIALLKVDPVTADAVETRMHQREGRDELETALDAIDRRFYSGETGESIEDSLLNYIEAHKDEIRLPA